MSGKKFEWTAGYVVYMVPGKYVGEISVRDRTVILIEDIYHAAVFDTLCEACLVQQYVHRLHPEEQVSIHPFTLTTGE